MTKKRVDSSRLALYDRLVKMLSANCPLSDNSSPRQMMRWRRAYNALFSIKAAARRQ